MKIVIISDIHGNFAALEHFPERHCDQLWCLGDLVDYGPKPHEVIEWVRRRATAAVRGNHDHAVGFNVDPEYSVPHKQSAFEAMRFTQEACTKDDIEFLRNLAVQRELVVGSNRFYLVHAIPTDPLFGYRPPDSELWANEVERINADFLVVGHTHTPFIRRIGGCTILNPGSLRRSKSSLACYAVWEDGEISFREYRYALADAESRGSGPACR
jgi:putative phosphoesterase